MYVKSALLRCQSIVARCSDIDASFPSRPFYGQDADHRCYGDAGATPFGTKVDEHRLRASSTVVAKVASATATSFLVALHRSFLLGR
jgi:hypothetical protein